MANESAGACAMREMDTLHIDLQRAAGFLVDCARLSQLEQVDLGCCEQCRVALAKAVDEEINRLNLNSSHDCEIEIAPETVTGWQRKGFKLYWCRLSQSKGPGRPLEEIK